MQAGNNTISCRGKLWAAKETANGKRCYLVRADWPATRKKRNTTGTRNRRNSRNNLNKITTPKRGSNTGNLPKNIDPGVDEVYPGLYN